MYIISNHTFNEKGYHVFSTVPFMVSASLHTSIRLEVGQNFLSYCTRYIGSKGSLVKIVVKTS